MSRTPASPPRAVDLGRRAVLLLQVRATAFVRETRRVAPQIRLRLEDAGRGLAASARRALQGPREREGTLDLDLRSPILLGLGLIAFGFVGFFAFAAVAPLHSAVIAVGHVTVESQRRVVQHLEGGIVEAVLVADGASVEAGDVLVRLDTGQALARRAQHEARLIAVGAEIARLEAELSGADTLAPERLLAVEAVVAGDPRLSRALALQEDLLRGRREERNLRAAALATEIAQTQEEVHGLEAQLVGRQTRLAIVQERLDATRALGENGHASRAQIASVEGEAAALEGERGDLVARIASAGQRRTRLTEELRALERVVRTEIGDRLQALEREFAETREGLAAAQDVLRRTEIRAPNAGEVQALSVHGPGAVIRGGEPLLEIVPREDTLIVEAELRPQDIETVHRGQDVFVRLSAFSFRRTPPVPGHLLEVSADRVVDPRTGQGSYNLKASLDAQTIADLGLALRPGMPAEVMVIQRERTLLDYLVDPFLQATERAFREN